MCFHSSFSRLVVHTSLSWISSCCIWNLFYAHQNISEMLPSSAYISCQCSTVTNVTGIANVLSKLLLKTLATTRLLGIDLSGFSTCQQSTEYYRVHIFSYSRNTPWQCPSRLYFTIFSIRISYEIMLEIDQLPLLWKISRSSAPKTKHGLTGFVLDQLMLFLYNRLRVLGLPGSRMNFYNEPRCT